MRLELTLPGAGTLSAHASAPVKVTVRSGHGRHATVRTRVLTRAVTPTAQAAERQSSEVATVILELSPAYRSLATRAGGLSATATVTLTAPGEPTAAQSIPVTFVSRAPAPSSKRKRATSTKHRAKKRRRT